MGLSLDWLLLAIDINIERTKQLAKRTIGNHKGHGSRLPWPFMKYRMGEHFIEK